LRRHSFVSAMFYEVKIGSGIVKRGIERQQRSGMARQSQA